MGKLKIKWIIAKEGLIILGLAVALYFLTAFFLKHMPVVLPEYKLEFTNGQTYTIVINPQIRNDANYRKFLKEAYNPPPKLIEQRIKEFTRSRNIKSALKSSSCINTIQVYLSKLYSDLINVTFVLKLAVVYLALLLLRFIFWALRILKGGKNC